HLALNVAGKPPQDQTLESDADEADAEARTQHGHPESSAGINDRCAEIGAEHEEAAVRQVRNAHQPEGERETGREQEQQPAEGDAVQRLDDPELHVLSSPPRALARGPESITTSGSMWHGQSVSAIFVVMDSGLAGSRPRPG